MGHKNTNTDGNNAFQMFYFLAVKTDKDMNNFFQKFYFQPVIILINMV